MVRDAKFADVPAIVDLLILQFRKSHYHRDGVVNVDEAETKRLLVTSIQRHSGKIGGSTFVQVAETDGMVTGLILGTLARVYSIGDKLMATDLFWTANGNVDPRDPVKLMQNMVAWAWESPHVIEVRVGATSVIEERPERVGAALERIGMERYGLIYRMEREKL
jgi:hypothetical protein